MKIVITNLELHEYFQNGCIRVKDTFMYERLYYYRYVYYGHSSGYKKYQNIDFEREFGFYKYHISFDVYANTQYATHVHPEYGLLIVENHHENHLIELREHEHINSFVCLSRRMGYSTEVVGERMFVCIWKRLKE